MTASSTVAGLGFVGAVPVSIWLAYRGYRAGFYDYGAIPLIFGAILVATLVGLFLLLPRLKRFERRF